MKLRSYNSLQPFSLDLVGIRLVVVEALQSEGWRGENR